MKRTFSSGVHLACHWNDRIPILRGLVPQTQSKRETGNGIKLDLDECVPSSPPRLTFKVESEEILTGENKCNTHLLQASWLGIGTPPALLYSEECNGWSKRRTFSNERCCDFHSCLWLPEQMSWSGHFPFFSRLTISLRLDSTLAPEGENDWTTRTWSTPKPHLGRERKKITMASR